MANEIIKIKELASKYQQIDSVMYVINKETLKEEHRKQLKNKATGIDGITKEEYSKNLDSNLTNLLEKMKKQNYKPKPVRRVNIPKIGSKDKRPLGIPAYEDKIVQGVIAKILNTIYEPMFINNSFGFRPKRSCHDAIVCLDKILHKNKINYVVDLDIKRIF